MAAIVSPDEEEAYLIAILDGTDGLDLAEFSWYDPESPSDCYRAWDFQWPWYTCEDKRQVDQGARATGKRLALDTPVPTPSGWSTMGELRAGDFVYGADGRPCRVLVAHPIEVNTDAYEVAFSDGSVIQADAEHLWLTYDKAARRSAARAANPNYLKTKRPQRLPQVRTTAEIAATLHWRTEANHSIPVTAPLVARDADLLIDPYVLGAWLGDGSSNSSQITSADEGILKEIERRGYNVRHLPLCSTTSGAAGQYVIEYVGKHNRKIASVTAHLRAIGVLNDKHIPVQYLRASERQRRELLAGIVDTDGHVDKRSGACEVSFKNEQLARGVFELLASLGEQPHLNRGDATLLGRVVGDRWRVGWKPRECPALLPRKAANFRPLAAQAARVTQRRIVDVRPISSVPMRCITVDSADHLYLVGEAMIPTHNTVGITMRAFQFPFAFPGQKSLLTAPELNHLRPLTDAIENRLLATRLTRELLPPGKGHGMNRQPHWQCTFMNGSQLVSRLPQKDGKGVKGQHVIQIEMDEAQDYPLAGWLEIGPTLNELPGASFRVHGVSKGVRDKFFETTEPDSGWTVHRPMAMNRPTWNPEQRERVTREYGGSRQNIDYRRNIYGDHGDASNSVFVLSRFMACVDTDEGSEYNTEVYHKIVIEFERFPQGGSNADHLALLHSWIDVPGSHFSGYSQKEGNKEVGAPKGYSAYWAGMDVGVTNHPSEILVYGQRTGTDFLELLLRVQMQRINTDDQMAVVARLFAIYGSKLKAFAIDKTGVGFPIWDQLSRYSLIGDRIYGFGFSENRVVAFEDRPMAPNETKADLAIKRNVVEASTDWLRNDYIDVKKMRLPYDREILLEHQQQTYTVVKDSGTPYGTRRVFGGGSFHSLDAAKMAMAGRHIPPLEAQLNEAPVQGSVLAAFMDY